mmetsp:Transcript_10283/g.18524  ORF Transcript_10283/g.18524 Transcript_10283/m.18524 type:complete len:240 (+) Transcript_10283:51-770(+)
MPYYEWIMLVRPDLRRNELGTVVKRTVQSMFENKSVVTQLGHLQSERGFGARTLAYRIRKEQNIYHHAYYVQIAAFMSPSARSEIARRITNDGDVIRHIVFKKPLHFACRPLPDGSEMLPQPPADPNAIGFEVSQFFSQFIEQNPDNLKFDAEQLGTQEAIHRKQSDEALSEKEEYGYKDVISMLEGTTGESEDDETNSQHFDQLFDIIKAGKDRKASTSKRAPNSTKRDDDSKRAPDS